MTLTKESEDLLGQPAWTPGQLKYLRARLAAIEAAVRAEQAAELAEVRDQLDALLANGPEPRIWLEYRREAREHAAEVERLTALVVEARNLIENVEWEGDHYIDRVQGWMGLADAVLVSTPVAPAPNSAPNPTAPHRCRECDDGPNLSFPEPTHAPPAPGERCAYQHPWGACGGERGFWRHERPEPVFDDLFHPFQPEPAPGESDDPPLGWPVWRAWFEGMESQGRYVAPERRSWDTLSEQDRDLDAVIETRVATFVLERHRRLQPQPAPGER